MFIATIGLLALFMLLPACKKDDPDKPPELTIYDAVDLPKSNSQNVYVHYMTWYDTPQSSKDQQWGMHWTMANRNPEITDQEGKRQIASHFYPLIGPYASRDKFVIEYHLLLMKYAGIDGIMIDWYGVHDVYDYASIKANTEAVINVLEKVGLEFSIVYEDRTLPNVVAQNKATSLVAAAREDMSYLQSQFFSKPFYTRINNQPLLLVFGPITFTTPGEWTEAFMALNPKPCFLTLWNSSGGAGANARGEYAWVYMDHTYLENFYSHRMPNLEIAIGSAYPGFVDYYVEGGWGDQIGWTIEHLAGKTLDETLQLAEAANPDYLQLVTWNDFGEGTIIEPTHEFGFSYLEKIMDYTGVSATPAVFDLIHELYLLRNQNKSNALIQLQLDQAFYYFVSNQVEKAETILQQIK